MISVVFGYPIETPSTIRETFDMCLEVQIYKDRVLLPLPATGMREYAKKNKFITDENKYLDSLLKTGLILNMTEMLMKKFAH